MKRGTYVKRSTYQKVVEENRKLLTDIKLLTDDSLSAEKIFLIKKWRDKFVKDKRLNAMLQEFAILYFEEHPELSIPRIDATTQAQLNTVGPKSFEAAKRLKRINHPKQ